MNQLLRRAAARLVNLLGSTIDGPEQAPTPTGPPPLIPCGYTWPCDEAMKADAPALHICVVRVLPNYGHIPGGNHVCLCGLQEPATRRPISHAEADRLARWLLGPTTYHDCIWPDHQLCPRHDLAWVWPAGRDCLGTCTNCNAPLGRMHEPSCNHYAPTSTGGVKWWLELTAEMRKAGIK